MTSAPAAIRLAELRCACGSADLIAVAPGGDPETVAGIVVDRGELVRCWCVACWPALRRVA